MRRLYHNNLLDDSVYVMDLLQYPNGVRLVRYRAAEDPMHADTVLTTRQYTGQQLGNLHPKGSRKPARKSEVSSRRQPSPRNAEVNIDLI